MTSTFGDLAAPVRALLAQSDEHRARYQSASPWPHLVLQGVFDPRVVAEAEREAAAVPPDALPLTPTARLRKQESHDRAILGPAGRALLDVLDGPDWTELVSRITGVPALLPDPGHYGAGLHRSGPGAFQMIHTDFNVNPRDGRHHRTSTLLYLNSTWLPEWGGALELWPADMSAVGRTVAPLAGTVMIWETGPTTAHGLPEVVCCPADLSRLSLACYHYTLPPPGGIPRRPFTTFKRRPQDPWWTGLPTRGDLGRALLPAKAWNAVAGVIRPHR